VHRAGLATIDGGQSSLRVKSLPPSLTDAVDTFLLANAIRDLRGDADQPRSMLVNVSRYKAVQQQIFELVSDDLSRTRTSIELHHADAATRHSVIWRVHERFNRTYSLAGFTWEQVLAQLPSSISDLRVMLFNSDTDKRISQDESSWDRPTRMIAVGGDVLSRGLTLEGLCVSYFYRRVTASDTLMQMARWFGYRDGYEDLCRLWINRESADNYRFAADSIDELRTDLRLMLRQKLTPEDFGLAVKKHPGSILITARNKMNTAQEVRRVVGLAGRRLETTTLLSDHSEAREDFRRLIDAAESDGYWDPASRGRWHRWIGVDRVLIADFLDRYAASAPLTDPLFSSDILSRWARAARAERFVRWDVATANGQSDAEELSVGQGRTLRMPKRRIRRDGDVLRVSGSSARLAGPTDLAQLLSQPSRKVAESAFRAEEPGKGIPERIYYPRLERPALIIYPLYSEGRQPGDSDDEHAVTIPADEYLVALKVAIPGDPTDPRNDEGDITYVINTVAQQNWLPEFRAEDDDGDLDA
jgi:hypothetical protein